MKRLIILLVIFSTIQIIAQSEDLDKLELKTGDILYGKVEKVTTSLVEFKEKETNLLYEYKKEEIRYIQLTNGKILTFEDASVSFDKPTEIQPQPVIVKEEGTGVGVIILAVIGGVLGFLLLLGAVAGG